MTVQTTVGVPQLLGVLVEVDDPVVLCDWVPQVQSIDGCDVPVFMQRRYVPASRTISRLRICIHRSAPHLADWLRTRLGVQIVPASGSSSELSAHQMAPAGAIAHSSLPSCFVPFVFLPRLATPALRLGVIGSWQRSESFFILRRYGRRSGQPSSSSLARRACVHVLPFSSPAISVYGYLFSWSSSTGSS